jgi:hypothetical protein
MKNKLPYALAIGLIIFTTIFKQFKGALTLNSISDALFLEGLLFLIIGVTLLVFSSGFFDLFQKSMHKSFSLLRKKRENTKFMPLSEVGHGAYGFWLIIATILILTSLVLLLLGTL